MVSRSKIPTGHVGVFRVERVDPAGLTHVAVIRLCPWNIELSAGDDGTVRLWPMPEVTQPPLDTLPYQELLGRLRGLTNLRAVEDAQSPGGYRVDAGSFPGWETAPTW